MTRLADVLDADQRTHLSVMLASGVLSAIEAAGMEAIIITSASEVSAWAKQRAAGVCSDPGTGLSGAARAGVSMVGSVPWLMIHADLPLVTSRAIETVVDACGSATVIVPSYDGGTTVIASQGPFAFSYGTGSFQRHYATAPDAAVMPSPELSIDIDTPNSLRPFLSLLDS
jgi:2-phospho-L-lactate guanylyltransferase